MLHLISQIKAVGFFAGRSALVSLFVLALPALAQTQPSADMNAASQIDAQAALDHSAGGLTFIKNRGQWDAEARYLVRIGGLDTWVTDSGLVFDFYERTVPEAEEPDARSLMMTEIDDARLTNAGSRRGHVVWMEFEGAAAGEVAGTHRLEGYHNYFLGNDASRWASYVPLYGEVIVSELYDGVGMRLYDDGGFLRYDLLTSPGADLAQVRLRFDGADAVWVTPDGDLAMETSLGEVRQAGLLAYQEIDGRQVAVPVVFTVIGEGVVGFEVEPLDPSLPLVIDPVIYSTFLGGGSIDVAYSIEVDASGNAFVAGRTSSTDFPTTAGAYQTVLEGSLGVAFVAKLNASGAGLIYATYLGGTWRDEGWDLTVESAGSVIVAGRTQSANFPTTEGAYQTSLPGGQGAFVTKLDADGAELVYSTFLGGSSWEYAYGIAVDASGNAYVTGQTLSTDFPTTEGALQPSHPGGNAATVFVTKLNTSAQPVYSTFLGGSNIDEAWGIAADASGNAFVIGRTASTDFPTTEGAFQTASPGDGRSAFVTKLDGSGTDLVYSTYLGGPADDLAMAITVDATGNAFVAGEAGPNFPTTAHAYQTTYPGGSRSAFVTQLDAAGAALVFSTYLGGAGGDGAYGIAVDAIGNVFVAGPTSSSTFPTTDGAFQTTYPGGNRSSFVTAIEPSGASLIYSTFLGGGDFDAAWDLALDGSDNAFVTGWTGSMNYPTTEGAFQTERPGFQSAFVTMLEIPGSVSTGPVGSARTFALESTYPNPFARSTRIQFYVPRSSEVTLEAYDLLGRRVATIAEEHFEAGTHERVFDASGLSTGVYVVRMTSGEFSQSRRVVVVR